MSNGTNNCIILDKVDIGYRHKKILGDINFAVEVNDTVAVLGLNGTGKSTLLRTIAGLQPAVSGIIYLNGKKNEDYNAESRARQLSVVLTGRGDTAPSLTVNEILQIARAPFSNLLHRLSAADVEMIDQVIDQLQLKELLNRKLFQLSDGEAQRVFIARALIQGAPVMLLDEPTSHLDIINKIAIFKLIRQLGQNKTMVFTSHEMDMALKVANKCLLIHRNGKYLFGSTQNLMESGAIGEFFNDQHMLFNSADARFDIHW